MSMLLGVAPVGAANPVDLGNSGSAAYDSNHNLTIGNQVKAEGDKNIGQNNTAIGTNTDTLRNVTEGTTTTNGQPLDSDKNKQLVDGEGQAHDLDKSTEAGGSTALGYNTHNEGDSSTAIGNHAKITNKPVTYYVDADGNKTASADNAVWYKDANGNPTKVPQVFRDADGNTTATPQYVHTTTTTDNSGQTVTKKEITTDKSLADKNSDGTPVYNYQASDNTDYLYTVTLYQSSQNSIAAGTDVTANGSNAVAVGYNSTADNSAVAIGDTAVAKENGVAIGKNTKADVEGSIALGKGSEADRTGGITGWDPKTGTTSTQEGLAWKSTEGALSIGNGSASRQITGVAAGSEDTDAVNLAQLKNAMTHYYSVNTTAETDGKGNNNYLNDGATGDNALAAGVSAVAQGDKATAVGTSANATSSQATAIGNSASATSDQSTAIGSNAGAHGSYATAFGASASATSSKSTAIGYNAGAHGDSATALGNSASANYYSTAIGSSATANGSYAIAMGNGSSSTDSSTIAIGSGAGAHSSSAIALGSGAFANSSYVIAIGNGASAQNGDYGIAIGNGASAQESTYNIAIGSGASAQKGNGTALGYNAKTTAPNGTALGSGASAYYHAIALGSSTASSSYALAAGDGANAKEYQAIALGNGAQSNVVGGIALGSSSTANVTSGKTGLDPHTGAASTATGATWVSTLGAVSVGTVDSDGIATGTRQINGVAAGTQDTDAVNVAQLKAMETKINTHYYSVNSTLSGDGSNYDNSGASGTNAMAVGPAASATKDNAVAIGYGAKADGVGATVIGQYGTATGQYALAFGGSNTDSTGTPVGNTASGANSLAFGERTAASGNNSTAFGWQTTATEKRATAFGERTTASGANSTAFGQLAVASGQNSTAFGNEAVANNYGTTAFGNRTEALGEYSTAFGNSTVAAGMNTVAFGTDNVAGAVLDGNGAYTNIVYQTNPKNGRVIKDTNGNPIERFREKMDARGNLAYTDDNGNTKSVIYTVSGGETHSYVLLQGEDGNTYIRDYRGNIRSAAIGDDGTVTVGDTALTNVTLKQATSGANGYHILSNANATVWGENSNASGEASTAFGENSTAAAENSLAALGGTVDETAANAAAIGKGAEAKLADSIALGSGALANRSSGSKGYDVLTGTASTDTSAAWVSNANAIAVGNDTEGSLMTRQITGVAAGSLDTDAVNVAQLKAAGLSFTTNTKDASNTTDNYKGYKVVSRRLGDTIAIKASDEADNHSYSTANLTTRIAENGDISILMDEKPTFTSVTTGDVIFAGNPDLTDKDGKAAKADTNVHYGTKTLTDGQNITSAGNDTQATRLHYKDDQGHTYEVATMDDGQIYAGDIKTDGTLDNTGFARTMNQKTTINGGVTDKDSLTDNNIGVVSNGTDTLTVKLAKDLKDLNSVTTGKTVQDDSGIKITNDAGDETKNVIINGDQISFGGNQVNNMGSGSDGTADGKPTYNTDTNGANIGDVKNIAGSTTDAAKLTGDSNITVTYNDQTAGGKNTVKLNDSITLGSDADKKVTIDGTAGTIKAGDKVSFDGSTGTGSIGGVTIGNQTGVATTKMDGGKAKTEDGTFVTGLTNTTWNPNANGIVSGRAATEDQLKTVSDTVNAGWELDVNGGKQKDVTPTSRKVNFKQGQNIIISGSGDDVTVATDDNVRFTTINVTGDKDASGSYTGGITIGKQSGGNSANPGPGYYITGLDNTSWNSAQIQSGRAATEDQLKQVAEDIKHGTVDGDKYITGGNATYAENGDGSAKLTGTNGLDGTISNLHDYYVTKGEVSDDGKKLTMTKNDGTTFDINLDKVMQSDMRLVKNPGSADGAYTVDNDGNLTLTVQDANGTEATKQTITLSGLASKAEVDKGLNFAANSGTAYNAKLGGTVTIKGSNARDGHDYSEENVTTEVDADGNITIKLDKDMTANTVTVSGKDGKDGQIGITGKDGADGTVTTIIKTIGKNGTDGTNGTAGVNGTDGITRIVYQDGKDGDAGTTTYTVATLDDGLKFGANTPVAGKTDNPVGNKLNSTINVKGAGTKELDKYSGQNLLTSVEQADDGTTTINILMDKNISADSVVVGQEGKAGKDGKDGYIGINGKDGADGITTTIIRTEKGQTGADGKNGKPGVDGTDITRIVYQNGQDGTDGKDTHTVATLDDGLKFAGDDGQNDDTKVITKKLNERLDIVGKAQGDLTDANIGVTKDDNGKLYIRLAKNVNLDEDGTLTAGKATIGHFTNTELTTNKGNHPVDGSYTIGLGNTDWNVTEPEYVSGRAATEDQLAKVSAAINNTATAAGKRTVVTVNDKSHPTTANPGTNAYGEYDSDNGNLMIAAERDSDGLMTYNIKMNDKLSLGKDGTDGQEGTLGLTGKDGLPGADGKQVYSTTIIKTEKGQAGKDGKTGKENLDGTDITRIVYTDKDGSNPQTVATLDDGLKFVGNDGQEVTRKLNETLSIKGGLDKDAVAKASNKNLGVRQNKAKDGLEIVMTDTPDFEKVTVGKDADKKITIGEQTVTGKKSDGTDGTAETGNYITGLDNTQWNKDNVVANRAATEGQLSQAINDIKGSANGGFGLADEAGNTVKKDLGQTVTVKGDGKNIETKVDGGALEVSLKKDVNLGNDGSIKAGNTTINSNGVDTNKVKVGDITITDQGINAGSKQITNVASGASEIIKGTDGKDVYKYDNDTNAANIGDVKRIAGEMKSNITNVTNDVTDVTNKVTKMGDQVTQVKNDVTQLQQDVKADRNYQGDDALDSKGATEHADKNVNVKFGSFLRLTGGADSNALSKEGNIGVIQKTYDNGETGLSVRLAKHLNLEKTTYETEENGQKYTSEIDGKGLTIKTSDANRTITVQDGKVDMGGNQIHNVAPGKAPTDAVNVSQLAATNQNISNLGGEVNKLGTRVNRVGANAAALAALHPLDFDPDDKWDFAAGYGNYKNANAAAIGAYYRPNEDTMFSVGGSFGGGENMVNAGISVKLGQGNHVSTSRVAMAKEIKDLRKDVADLKAVVNQQSALIDKLTGVNSGQLSGSDELFPDVPSNHWAYEYVTKLRQAGILTGYPDGNFAGDRMMTRYEFAAIVYRAIMAGAAANPNLNRDGTLDRLAKEFSGEMKYIRIDTIRKDRNGKPTIQRVRVIKEEEK